ncbi:DMT family transporter [Nocardioides sp. GY 10113]|uniref:DMT family transporter n=1 Tax=Nocardioides sp. GY 10113 TaxID=2569761 RepID=UPI0010A7FEFF|nr:DMT family transporter [Nocardioides sp. GY 10113]TIC81482.1 DMT family transporter [Nocardioides sp. GY 10113]
MGILFALTAAGAYGVSDFVGGLASRRTSAWPVALLSGVGALLGSLLLAAGGTGDPAAADLWWGLLAGLGSGFGTAFLYRGFASGRMGVVAPVSAVGAALLPVAVSVLAGERPALLVWLGIAAALPGIWLVAREPATDNGPLGGTAGLLDGGLAGVGFGVLFIATGQVPDGAGYWPLVATQAASMVAIVALAMLFGASWRPTARTEAWGLAAGLLATLAVLCFLLATQAGLLTIAAVLTSLYPAITVLLAALVLRERIFPPQAVGLALCGGAVALVALG